MNYQWPAANQVVRIFLLQLLPVPLGLLSGKVVLYWGGAVPNFKDVALLLGKGVFFFAALHVLLVWPIHQFGKKDLSQISSVFLQLLVVFTMTLLPVLSFGFYFSNVKTGLDLFELLLTVVPCVLIACLAYIQTQRPFLFSLLLSLPLFWGLFILNDILGPFSTRVQYLSDGGYALLLKTIFLTTAVCFAFFTQTWKERTLSSDLLLLFGLSVPLLHFIVPFMLRSFKGKEVSLISISELYFLGLIFVGLMARVRLRAAEVFVRIWSVGLAFYSVLVLTQMGQNTELTFADLHRLGLCYSSMIFLLSLAFRSSESSAKQKNVISQHAPVLSH